jgi:hypothetical protein
VKLGRGRVFGFQPAVNLGFGFRPKTSAKSVGLDEEVTAVALGLEGRLGAAGSFF